MTSEIKLIHCTFSTLHLTTNKLFNTYSIQGFHFPWLHFPLLLIVMRKCSPFSSSCLLFNWHKKTTTCSHNNWFSYSKLRRPAGSAEFFFGLFFAHKVKLRKMPEFIVIFFYLNQLNQTNSCKMLSFFSWPLKKPLTFQWPLEKSDFSLTSGKRNPAYMQTTNNNMIKKNNNQ